MKSGTVTNLIICLVFKTKVGELLPDCIRLVLLLMHNVVVERLHWHFRTAVSMQGRSGEWGSNEGTVVLQLLPHAMWVVTS